MMNSFKLFGLKRKLNIPARTVQAGFAQLKTFLSCIAARVSQKLFGLHSHAILAKEASGGTATEGKKGKKWMKKDSRSFGI